MNIVMAELNVLKKNGPDRVEIKHAMKVGFKLYFLLLILLVVVLGAY